MKNIRLALLSGLALVALLASTVFAQSVDISTALYSANLRASNTGGALTNIIAPFAFSGQSLVDQDFINSDALNSVVIGTDGSAVPSMPGSTQMAVEACRLYVDIGPVYTDFTTECNDSTIGDIDLLPAAAAVSDSFLFGLQSPGRIISFSISQAAVDDAVILWYYWDGSAWALLTNVEDTSSGFEVIGFNTLSYDLPTDWAESTIDGTLSFWIRANIDSISSQTTQPLGTQAWWESGNWWTFIPSIGQNEQVNYGLYLGGSTDFQTFHHITPGAAGVITSDDALLELGDQYNVAIDGFIDTSVGANKYLLQKTDAITIEVTADEQLTASLYQSSSEQLSLSSGST
ncbi:hypothetical protein LCGC14_1591940 [marine sediment metagenome]|uniref:Uncharacterized protein n=1 Tax=marine sediment metagenome TaxID=412755 RepID=A0A0F9KUG0_9ZZZZ